MYILTYHIIDNKNRNMKLKDKPPTTTIDLDNEMFVTIIHHENYGKCEIVDDLNLEKRLSKPQHYSLLGLVYIREKTSIWLKG